MKPQFTTPCYVRIDDAQQRKEVCEKLSQMGYKNIAIKDDEWILTQCESTNVEWLIEYMKTAIECFDIPTFLDLAAMRSDTDKWQWFVFTDDIFEATRDENNADTGGRYKKHSEGDFVYCNYDDVRSSNVRKATAQEIIQWHKQKGETK